MGHKTRHEQKAAGKFRKHKPKRKRMKPLKDTKSKYKNIRVILEGRDD